MSWQMYDIIGKVMVIVGCLFALRIALGFLESPWDGRR